MSEATLEIHITAKVPATVNADKVVREAVRAVLTAAKVNPVSRPVVTAKSATVTL